MQHNYSVSYRNVRLVPLHGTHIENLRIWRNNPVNTAYLRSIGEITPQMQQKWYQSYLNNNDELAFAIYETETLNRHIGSLSLYHFRKNRAEFGKILIGDSDAHGRKAGLNALLAVLIIAFMQLKLDKVTLEVFAENGPAVHIYKKAGFFIKEQHQHETGKLEYTMEITKELFEKQMVN